MRLLTAILLACASAVIAQDCVTVNKCGSDASCIAKCITSAGPTEDQVIKTTQCKRECPDKFPNDNVAIVACDVDCERRFYLASNVSPITNAGNGTVAKTGGSGSKSSAGKATVVGIASLGLTALSIAML